MASPSTGFQPWDSGHQDTILSTAWDYHGRRLATGSSDQMIRVWEKSTDKSTGIETFILIASWHAHSGEVTKVKFVSPYSSHIASLSSDCSLKIWAEDVLSSTQQTRRYLCLVAMRSETRMPYSSVDFKCIPPGVGGYPASMFVDPDAFPFDESPEGSKFAGSEQYMAVTTTDGLLVVYKSEEPTDVSHHPFSNWTEIFRTYLQFLHRRFLAESNVGRVAASGAYTLASETSFKAVFDPSPLPTFTAVGAGLPRHSLGLAVVAMNNLFIFRTDNSRSFYLATRLDSGGAPGSPRADILRDVAWAPGNVRGYDLVAAAGKGGWVWVWSLKAEPLPSGSVEYQREDDDLAFGRRESVNSEVSNKTAIQDAAGSPPAPEMDHTRDDPEARPKSSGGGGNIANPPRPLTTPSDRLAGKIICSGELVAELKHPSATWTCEWNILGDVLITTADDAVVRTWKQAIDGQWLECGCVET